MTSLGNNWLDEHDADADSDEVADPEPAAPAAPRPFLDEHLTREVPVPDVRLPMGGLAGLFGGTYYGGKAFGPTVRERGQTLEESELKRTAQDRDAAAKQGVRFVEGDARAPYDAPEPKAAVKVAGEAKRARLAEANTMLNKAPMGSPEYERLKRDVFDYGGGNGGGGAGAALKAITQVPGAGARVFLEGMAGPLVGADNPETGKHVPGLIDPFVALEDAFRAQPLKVPTGEKRWVPARDGAFGAIDGHWEDVYEDDKAAGTRYDVHGAPYQYAPPDESLRHPLTDTAKAAMAAPFEPGRIAKEKLAGTSMDPQTVSALGDVIDVASVVGPMLLHGGEARGNETAPNPDPLFRHVTSEDAPLRPRTAPVDFKEAAAREVAKASENAALKDWASALPEAKWGNEFEEPSGDQVQASEAARAAWTNEQQTWQPSGEEQQASEAARTVEEPDMQGVGARPAAPVAPSPDPVVSLQENPPAPLPDVAPVPPVEITGAPGTTSTPDEASPRAVERPDGGGVTPAVAAPSIPKPDPLHDGVDVMFEFVDSLKDLPIESGEAAENARQLIYDALDAANNRQTEAVPSDRVGKVEQLLHELEGHAIGRRYDSALDTLEEARKEGVFSRSERESIEQALKTLADDAGERFRSDPANAKRVADVRLALDKGVPTSAELGEAFKAEVPNPILPGDLAPPTGAEGLPGLPEVPVEVRQRLKERFGDKRAEVAAKEEAAGRKVVPVEAKPATTMRATLESAFDNLGSNIAERVKTSASLEELNAAKVVVEQRIAETNAKAHGRPSPGVGVHDEWRLSKLEQAIASKSVKQTVTPPVADAPAFDPALAIPETPKKTEYTGSMTMPKGPTAADYGLTDRQARANMEEFKNRSSVFSPAKPKATFDLTHEIASGSRAETVKAIGYMENLPKNTRDALVAKAEATQTNAGAADRLVIIQEANRLNEVYADLPAPKQYTPDEVAAIEAGGPEPANLPRVAPSKTNRVPSSAFSKEAKAKALKILDKAMNDLKAPGEDFPSRTPETPKVSVDLGEEGRYEIKNDFDALKEARRKFAVGLIPGIDPYTKFFVDKGGEYIQKALDLVTSDRTLSKHEGFQPGTTLRDELRLIERGPGNHAAQALADAKFAGAPLNGLSLEEQALYKDALTLRNQLWRTQQGQPQSRGTTAQIAAQLHAVTTDPRFDPSVFAEFRRRYQENSAKYWQMAHESKGGTGPAPATLNPDYVPNHVLDFQEGEGTIDSGGKAIRDVSPAQLNQSHGSLLEVEGDPIRAQMAQGEATMRALEKNRFNQELAARHSMAAHVRGGGVGSVDPAEIGLYSTKTGRAELSEGKIRQILRDSLQAEVANPPVSQDAPFAVEWHPYPRDIVQGLAEHAENYGTKERSIRGGLHSTASAARGALWTYNPYTQMEHVIGDHILAATAVPPWRIPEMIGKYQANRAKAVAGWLAENRGERSQFMEDMRKDKHFSGIFRALDEPGEIAKTEGGVRHEIAEGDLPLWMQSGKSKALTGVKTALKLLPEQLEFRQALLRKTIADIWEKEGASHGAAVNHAHRMMVDFGDNSPIEKFFGPLASFTKTPIEMFKNYTTRLTKNPVTGDNLSPAMLLKGPLVATAAMWALVHWMNHRDKDTSDFTDNELPKQYADKMAIVGGKNADGTRNVWQSYSPLPTPVGMVKTFGRIMSGEGGNVAKDALKSIFSHVQAPIRALQEYSSGVDQDGRPTVPAELNMQTHAERVAYNQKRGGLPIEPDTQKLIDSVAGNFSTLAKQLFSETMQEPEWADKARVRFGLPVHTVHAGDRAMQDLAGDYDLKVAKWRELTSVPSTPESHAAEMALLDWFIAHGIDDKKLNADLKKAALSAATDEAFTPTERRDMKRAKKGFVPNFDPQVGGAH